MVFPSVLIISIVALFIFYEFNYKARLRRQEKHEDLREKHEEQLKRLLNEKKDETENYPDEKQT